MTHPFTADAAEHQTEEPRRVHWLELFFDLVFVAFIGQLAHGIHGDPGPSQFSTFVLLFLPAWWAWVNIVSVVNLLPKLTTRQLGAAMIAAMAASSLMAASAPEAFGERAWAFSLGNAALRLILLVLWLYKNREETTAERWRIWVYNGGTALVWLVAAFLPLHIAVILWAASILVEMTMVLLGARFWRDQAISMFDVEHASERLSLFVVIGLGECIFTIVSDLAQTWTSASLIAGAAGFLVVALVGWNFFQYGTDAIRGGLVELKSRHDFQGVLQTTMFMPFLLVLGIMAIAASIATSIEEPGHHLPLGAGIALGAGMALLYLTNAGMVLRFGRQWRVVLPWAVPGIIASLALVPVSQHASASWSLGIAFAVLLVLSALAELVSKRSASPA